MNRILVAGATGLLGSRIVRALLQQQRQVRALVRDPARGRQLEQLGAELVVGDLTDPPSLQRACLGVSHVISTANGIMNKARNAPQRIDVQGTRALAEAARNQDVQRFVYVSAIVARPDSVAEFLRAKYAAQEAVRASGVRYTIVRSAAYMDIWAQILFEKAKQSGQVTIFGDGKRPINFVAVDDVARMIIALHDDAAAENQVVEVAGPQDLTLSQVVDIYERQTGQRVRRKSVPVPAIRVMRRLVQPFSPVTSRLMSMGLEVATRTPQWATPRRAGTTYEGWFAAELAEARP